MLFFSTFYSSTIVLKKMYCRNVFNKEQKLFSILVMIIITVINNQS